MVATTPWTENSLSSPEPAAGGIPALPPALTPRASREDGDKDEPSPRASVARATRPDSLEDKLFKYKDYDL